MREKIPQTGKTHAKLEKVSEATQKLGRNIHQAFHLPRPPSPRGGTPHPHAMRGGPSRNRDNPNPPSALGPAGGGRTSHTPNPPGRGTLGQPAWDPGFLCLPSAPARRGGASDSVGQWDSVRQRRALYPRMGVRWSVNVLGSGVHPHAPHRRGSAYGSRISWGGESLVAGSPSAKALGRASHGP